MQAPRTLAAAFLSAAMILTSGLALADKGGKHHGENAAGSASSPASADSKHDEGAGGNRAANTPGSGIGHTEMDHHFNNNGPSAFGKQKDDDIRTRGAAGLKTGETDTQFRFHGSVSGMDEKSARVELNLRDGSKRQFDVDTAVINDLKSRKDTSNLVFFSVDGNRITSCAKIGQTDRARVTGMNNGSIIIQTANGESRLLVMDQRSIQRLHLHAGSDVSVTTGGPQGGRIVAMDMLKKHWSDKFSAKGAAACGACRETASRQFDMEAARHKASGKQSDNDRAGVAVAQRCNGGRVSSEAKANDKGGKCRAGADVVANGRVARVESDTDKKHSDVDVAHKCTGGDKEQADKGGKCRAGADVDKEGTKVAADVDVAHKCTGGDKEHADKGGKCRAGADVDKEGTKVAADVDVAHKCTGGDKDHADKGGKCRAGADVDKDHSKVAADVDVAHKCTGGDKEHADKGGKCRAGADVDKDRTKVAGDVDVTHKCTGGGKEHADKGGKCHAGSSAAGSSTTTVAQQPQPARNSGSVPGAAAGNGTVANNGTASPGHAPGAPVVVAGNMPNRTPGMAPNGPIVNSGMAPLVRGTNAGYAPAGSSATPSNAAAPGPIAMAGSPARHPTRVMGAAVGPTSGQIRLVRPMANTPCVWRKTTVAAATYHRYRVVGTSYTRAHHPMHRTACH